LIAQSVCPNGRIAIPTFDPAADATLLSDTAAAFLRARGRSAVFVGSPEEAAHITHPGYPVLLTPRDTMGEKEIEVFEGRGETAEPLGLRALQALRPAPIERQALDGALAELSAFVAGEKAAAGQGEIEAVIA